MVKLRQPVAVLAHYRRIVHNGGEKDSYFIYARVQTPNPLARPKAASLVEELRGLKNRGLRDIRL